MSVRFRKDRNKWQVCVSINGKRINVQCDTKREAQDLNADLKLKKLGFKGLENPRYSIEEAFSTYLSTESKQKSDASYKVDRSLLDLALKFLNSECKKFYVEQIQLEDLQLFQIFVGKALKWSDTTVSMRMKILKSVLNKLMITERIRKNPAEHWKTPRGVSNPRRAMTQAEFETLIQSDPPSWLLPVLFFIRLTGARGASVAALTWADVDFSRARLLLSSKKGGLKKKKTIAFPMYPELLHLLSRLKNSAASDFVFLDENGAPLTGRKISLTAHRLIKKSGLKDIVLYGLRHALATDLIEAGVPTEMARQLMGHSNVTQLQTYTQGLNSDSLKDSMILIRGKTNSETTQPDATESDNTTNVLTLKIVK